MLKDMQSFCRIMCIDDDDNIQDNNGEENDTDVDKDDYGKVDGGDDKECMIIGACVMYWFVVLYNGLNLVF